MRRTVLTLLALSLASFGCRGSENPDRRAGRGMVPTSERSGRPLTIPTPERAHAPEAGKLDIPTTVLPEQSIGNVEGTLIHRGGRSLSVRDVAGEMVELSVPGAVRVTRGHETISASQLREGSQVRASYEQRGDQKVVTELELLQTSPPRPDSHK
jgi:hypothetical protein